MRQILVTLEDVKKDGEAKPASAESYGEARVKIRRIDKSLPLPTYQTKGSVGFDLYCREAVIINPKEIKVIKAGINVKVPEGYMLAILPRSSTAKKKGLMLANSMGVLDQDYCGNNDEVGILFYNIKNEHVKIDRGERLAQGVFLKVGVFNWEEVDDMDSEDRGGFGSTDKKTGEIEDFI